MTLTADAPTRAEPRRHKRTWLRRSALAVLAVLAAVVLLMGLTVFTVVRASNMDKRSHVDAIVVLGAAQFQGKPSPVLANRLRHAADLYREGVASRVITVGGNRPGDITTEGQAGRRALIKAGVPAAAVIAVPTGSDTLTSIDAVARRMAELGLRSAVFVSDPTHMARVTAMGSAYGITSTGSPTESGPASAVTMNYLVRETGGLLRFWLVDQWGIERVVEAKSD